MNVKKRICSPLQLQPALLPSAAALVPPDAIPREYTTALCRHARAILLRVTHVFVLAIDIALWGRPPARTRGLARSPVGDDQPQRNRRDANRRPICKTSVTSYLLLPRGNQQSRKLSEATGALLMSLDYSVTLARVARLAVEDLADWCGVEILNPDQTIKRGAVAAADPRKHALAPELLRYPIVPDRPSTPDV